MFTYESPFFKCLLLRQTRLFQRKKHQSLYYTLLESLIDLSSKAFFKVGLQCGNSCTLITFIVAFMTRIHTENIDPIHTATIKKITLITQLRLWLSQGTITSWLISGKHFKILFSFIEFNNCMFFVFNGN